MRFDSEMKKMVGVLEVLELGAYGIGLWVPCGSGDVEESSTLHVCGNGILDDQATGASDVRIGSVLLFYSFIFFSGPGRCTNTSVRLALPVLDLQVLPF